MKFRQVHIDFHTSEKITGIGKAFDKAEFQAALQTGHVDSVTLFAKCHHGWSYYPSMVNDMHPELSYDLLGEQIAAAREIGVNVVAYLSGGVDEKYAAQHRECVAWNLDNPVGLIESYSKPGYRLLCMNSPYLDHLMAQLREMLERYRPDGVFIDIVAVRPCCCAYCSRQMLAEGMDPTNSAHVRAFGERVYANYAKRVREEIDSVIPGLPVFHNGGHITRGRRDLAHYNTHLELESLPTGGWGYDHFPISASYARTLGMEFLGMTGKFHTAWGEFGGFKHPNALRYEAALSVANGAACSIGDQLHPSGKIDEATYRLIGTAYQEIETKEPWLHGARNLVDIGVLGTEAMNSYSNKIQMTGFEPGCGASERGDVSDSGCCRILLEGKYLFNFIDVEEDFTKYKLLILPDRGDCDEALMQKLAEYTAQGGKLLVSGSAGIGPNGRFAADLGCQMEGKSHYRPDFCKPEFSLKSIFDSTYVMYAQGYTLKEVTGDVLANRVAPYFNRTLEHFCSHKHAPSNPQNTQPAIVQGRDGIYVGWNIFEDYATAGSIITKEIVCHLIDCLLTRKSVTTNLPAQGIITLTQQENRRIVHLLYAAPVKRGNGIEIVEDLLSLYDIQVTVDAAKAVRQVYLAPQNKPLEFESNPDGSITFKVPRFECHQMVVLEK